MVAPSAQRMWVVSVTTDRNLGTFQTFSGGETSSEVTKNYDGGSLTAETIASPAETDNITVSRAYKRDRDAEVLTYLRNGVGKLRAKVSKSPTDENLVIIGKPTTYTNALLVRVSEPESDSGSGDISMFELEFAVGTVA